MEALWLMNSKLFLSFFLFAIPSLSLIGQTKLNSTLHNRIVEIAEQSIENEESNAEFNTYLEHLEYYALHPISINTATKEEFIDLGLLSEFEIQHILDYRSNLGEFVELHELILAGLPKSRVFDLELFFSIKAIEVIPIKTPYKLIKAMDHQVFLRSQRIIEEQKGYSRDAPKYEGNPNKYYVRYAGNYYKNLQIGFVLEKDDGESFYQKSNAAKLYQPFSGFDYRNAYVSIKSKSIIKQSVVGAYTLQLGQGLLSWSGFALGKSVYTMQAKKTGTILRPYSSANEYLFYKGIASYIQIKKWVILPYFSYKNIDAKSLQAGSISATGYHRTESEIQKKEALTEFISGVSIGSSWKKLEFRNNTQYLHYSNAIAPGKDAYQLFNFNGNQLVSSSFDYKYSFSKTMIFGEHSFQNTRNSAHLFGMITQLNNKLSLISIYRNYSAGYYAPYSNSFGEQSKTANEKGLFLGFDFRPHTRWNLTGYIDQYKKPWLSYQMNSPSSGTDLVFQINHKYSENLDHYLRFKHETNQQNETISTVIKGFETQNNLRLRYHLNYSVNKSFSIKTRVELNYVGTPDSKELGVYMSQDVKFSAFHYKVDFTSRIAFFNTPSFASAIYAYESDVLYYFSVPAYYNQGVRYYAMIAYDLSKNLKLWVRFSRWIYTDTKLISSGNAEIKGDTKSDIKIQLRYLF